MMKAIGLILLEAGMLMGLFSFGDKETHNDNTVEGIKGVWMMEYLGDVTNIYKRLNEMPDEGHAYWFKANGELIVQQNAGWCGTPPISYTQNTGSWRIEGDSLVMKYPFWGGQMTEVMQLGPIEGNSMKLMYIDQYNEFDERFD